MNSGETFTFVLDFSCERIREPLKIRVTTDFTDYSNFYQTVEFFCLDEDVLLDNKEARDVIRKWRPDLKPKLPEPYEHLQSLRELFDRDYLVDDVSKIDDKCYKIYIGT